MPKPKKDNTRTQKNYKPVSLMNTDANTFYKILPNHNHIPQYIKKIIHHNQNKKNAKDLLHLSPEKKKRKHKKKRLVQSPNSYKKNVKCPKKYKITTVFSHTQTVVLCVGCSTVLCQPTGEKKRLTEKKTFRRKQH
uniref:40S ribosomal protein S27-like n=1 Tax=Odobenus rosmarus divergens TaxID=9708 RepID=UPI00063C044B|nr:PREDICTED: 40S ribosomal protein S27-like [Odobenus rosmarus divergens]